MSSHFDETAPIPWIGLYIAVASLVCTLTMVADLLHGFRRRKFWFPCKYFTLNAATMTIIAIAMKLPVDLTTKMQGGLDQLAKHSGVVLMCSMMANFMPSLGTMDNTELLLNMIALVILVVTITVNVCIQIGTGIVHIKYEVFAILDIVSMLVLLLISVSLALNVPTSKRILERKYQEKHKKALVDQQGEKTVEKLMRNVRKYWIMAETGNPQFVMAFSPACFAAAFISHIVSMRQLAAVCIDYREHVSHYNSDYKWSVRLILAFQCIGAVVGSYAPVFRMSKFSIEWSMIEMKVFRVENYWFELLEDWKWSDKALQKIRRRRCKKLAHFAKNLILNICIGFQILVVIMCKMIQFFPFIIVIFYIPFFYCFWLLKKLQRFLCAPSTSSVPSGSQPMGEDTTETETDHIRDYVVQLEDEREISKGTLKSISKAVDGLVETAEKNRPRHLIPLLKKHSMGLDGVSKFENDEIPPLPSDLEEAPCCCWSLAVVTLASIAIALMKDESSADRFLQSISEGLIYVNHVEENLNNNGTNLSEARKAANQVWLGVELDKKWLGNRLRGKAQKGKTPTNILLWLRDTATGINYKYTAANSMYKISQTILSDGRYQSRETVVEGLEVMISDILCACLTNIPQVINKKCHTGGIEKRENSVRAAAMLLGKTKEMLETLEHVQSPDLDPDQMAYLDQWRRASLNRQNPVHPVMQSV